MFAGRSTNDGEHWADRSFIPVDQGILRSISAWIQVISPMTVLVERHFWEFSFNMVGPEPGKKHNFITSWFLNKMVAHLTLRTYDVNKVIFRNKNRI